MGASAVDCLSYFYASHARLFAFETPAYGDKVVCAFHYLTERMHVKKPLTSLALSFSFESSTGGGNPVHVM